MVDEQVNQVGDKQPEHFTVSIIESSCIVA